MTPLKPGGEWNPVEARVRSVSPDELWTELHTFESRYGMDSKNFVAAFRNGHLDETEDFLAWRTATPRGSSPIAIAD
jgi:hypothetical protein